jgi:hypothetical protein
MRSQSSHVFGGSVEIPIMGVSSRLEFKKALGFIQLRVNAFRRPAGRHLGLTQVRDGDAV